MAQHSFKPLTFGCPNMSNNINMAMATSIDLNHNHGISHVRGNQLLKLD